MLYGKDSPILKSRTKTSLQKQLETLISLNSMDKEDSLTMSEEMGGSVGDGNEDEAADLVYSVDDTYDTDTDQSAYLQDSGSLEGVDVDDNTDASLQLNDEVEDIYDSSCPSFEPLTPKEKLEVSDSMSLPMPTTESEPAATTKPRSMFRHLFDPNVLTDGSDLDLMSLEMQCLSCVIKAPMTSMYCHAVDAHNFSLCIYCLATFQHARQLEVHLLREHRIQPSDFSEFYESDAISKTSDVEFFCFECNKSVTLSGSKKDDEVTVKDHNCKGDEVLCIKCARQFSLKEMVSHIANCQGKVKKKVNPITHLPMFIIKQEPEDDAGSVSSSSDNSPQKRSPQKPSAAPPPQTKIATIATVVEPVGRLRNRDNKCKNCFEIVPPSKTAQHALECGGRRLSSSTSRNQTLVVSPEKAVATISTRTSLQKTSPRRNLTKLTSAATADTSAVNGGNEVVPIDPHKIKLTDSKTDCIESGFNSTSVKIINESTSRTVFETPDPETDAASLELPPTKVEAESTPTATFPSYITKETADTSCDTSISKDVDTDGSSSSTDDVKPVNEQSSHPLHGDALLSEEDPDKRLSILITELCDYLEFKHQEEIRMNDDMDTRTRAVVFSQSIPQLTSDDIIEKMISSCCHGCTYCRQAKVVGVDRRQLVIHLLTQHTWELKIHEEQLQNMVADVTESDSVTQKTPDLKLDWRQFKIALLEKVFQLTNHVFNYPNEEPFGEWPCECLLCGCQILTQKLLFPHWSRAHPRISMKCYLCHEKFLFVGALFSHLCFGTPQPLIKAESGDNDATSLVNGSHEDGTQSASGQDHDSSTCDFLRYQCRLCDNLQLPGFFNYIIHLRIDHLACELCLQFFTDRKELQHHIIKKHKLNYYCWKCNYTYADIDTYNKHMFWKHGNASVPCNMCGDKKWLFVYHFCRPPTEFVCDVCSERFTKPKFLKVHRRMHTGEKLRKCPKHSCDERFISKKLLQKHLDQVHNPNYEIPVVEPEPVTEESDEILASEQPNTQAQQCSTSEALDENDGPSQPQPAVFSQDSQVADEQENTDTHVRPLENIESEDASENKNNEVASQSPSESCLETDFHHPNDPSTPVAVTEVTPAEEIASTAVADAFISQNCNGEGTKQLCIY